MTEPVHLIGAEDTEKDDRERIGPWCVPPQGDDENDLRDAVRKQKY